MKIAFKKRFAQMATVTKNTFLIAATGFCAFPIAHPGKRCVKELNNM